jgi:hypothetical protein
MSDDDRDDIEPPLLTPVDENDSDDDDADDRSNEAKPIDAQNCAATTPATPDSAVKTLADELNSGRLSVIFSSEITDVLRSRGNDLLLFSANYCLVSLLH